MKRPRYITGDKATAAKCCKCGAVVNLLYLINGVCLWCKMKEPEYEKARKEREAQQAADKEGRSRAKREGREAKENA